MTSSNGQRSQPEEKLRRHQQRAKFGRGGGGYIIEVELEGAGLPVGFEFVPLALERERESRHEPVPQHLSSTVSNINELPDTFWEGGRIACLILLQNS